jgi:PPM family protein phosphatase
MESHLLTEAGGHLDNEDVVLVRRHPDNSALLVGALGDGQGGRSGGARAARVAVETCIARALTQAPLELADPSIWTEVTEAADRAVRDDADAGYTTLVGWAASARFIVGASAGDSAAYLWANGQVTDLTAGQLKNPPIGTGTARLTPFSALPLAPWRLLVMSDGVWKYVGTNRVWDLIATLEADDLLGALREDVVQRSSGTFPDDFTAVVVSS